MRPFLHLQISDGLAVLQRRVERHHGAIDPRAAAAVAQVGVQGVGEVHRGGGGRQLDDRRLGREHVDAVV